MAQCRATHGNKWPSVFRCTAGTTLILVMSLYVYDVSIYRRHLTSLASHYVRNGLETTVKASLEFKRTHETTLGLLRCPFIPPNLTGRIPVDNQSTETLEALAARHRELEDGGLWRPTDCRSRHHVAIVVPYRQREHHLKLFLTHMHPFLQRQQLDYGIYIVDQALPTRFNRAMLMNIGYAEASKQANYSCYIFHDVDLLPEDDRNIYSCPDQPRHMSVAVDKFKYKLPYGRLLGGVCALRTDHFKKINGFSNKFFGWGGEDDDFYNRVSFHKLKVKRYPIDIARYKMMRHGRDKLNRPNSTRTDYLLRTSKERLATDGLNSLKYKLLDLKKKPLYTWIYVNIEQ